MSLEQVPDNLAHTLIAGTIPCRRCGYNLYSSSVTGQCPECGTDVWQSILYAVDPESSRLPRLANPTGVGNALVVLMACLVASLILALAHPLAIALEWVAPASWVLYAAIAGAAGLWSVWSLAPARGGQSTVAIWRDVSLLGAGLIAWSAVLGFKYWVIRTNRGEESFILIHLGLAIAAVVALGGLSGVLKAVGQRSREYRTSQGGRQSIRAMIAGIVGGAIGQVLILLGRDNALETIGTVIVYTTHIMLLIGMAYLLVNAWWIRRALRRPYRTLDQILAPPEAPESPNQSAE